MKTSTRIIAAAIASLALGAAGLAFAHPGMGPGDMGRTGAGMGMGMHGGGHGGMHGMQQGGDPIAYLATLKAELKISAAQEPAWQQYESVVRQQVEARQAMQARLQDPAAAATVDHAAQREAMMKLRDGRQAAHQALYAALSPEQKTIADQKLGMGRGHGQGRYAARCASAK
jgi:hypothetical protein